MTFKTEWNNCKKTISVMIFVGKKLMCKDTRLVLYLSTTAIKGRFHKTDDTITAKMNHDGMREKERNTESRQ